MALEKISGTSYQSAAVVTQKPEFQTNDVIVEKGGNLNVSDVAIVTRATGGGQTQNEQEKGQNGNTATEKQIKDAISRVNSNLKQHRTRCEFSYHEETNRVSIKILDEDTKEVIKEIPPEETLAMVEKMWELAGLFLDEKR